MKIVIVGGGTAGWISAAILLKYKKDCDVTVIESSKIGIIGAGEGSTGTLPWLIRNRWFDDSINEIDFLRKTKGTIKLAINLKNWKGDGSQIYSPIHSTNTADKPIDTEYFASILKYGRGDLSSFHALLLEDNLTTFKKQNGRIVQGLGNHSYHFDGVEVGKFFKEWCTARGVIHIDSEVIDTNFDDREHLKSISLSNGQLIESEFWFDCSGFNRVLMGKTKNKWISYKEYLPTNTALPFSLPISSKTVKFETLAETMNAGWMWKKPLQHRHGAGYVFCDGFQSVDQSLQELEKNLGHKVEPNRIIKFEPGRYEKMWYNNIVAIGLSSHFLEPLQATSIHISITSIAQLVLHKLRGDEINYNNIDVDRYNNQMGVIIDDSRDLIQMHYLSGRNDTPFWKYITNELTITEHNKYLKDISKYRTVNVNDMNIWFGTAGYAVWQHPLEMAGCFDKDMIKKELESFRYTQQAIYEIDKVKTDYKNMKSQMVSSEEFFKYLKA
jgi:tryptophan halogenase